MKRAELNDYKTLKAFKRALSRVMKAMVDRERLFDQVAYLKSRLKATEGELIAKAQSPIENLQNIRDAFLEPKITIYESEEEAERAEKRGRP